MTQTFVLQISKTFAAPSSSSFADFMFSFFVDFGEVDNGFLVAQLRALMLGESLDQGRAIGPETCVCQRKRSKLSVAEAFFKTFA